LASNQLPFPDLSGISFTNQTLLERGVVIKQEYYEEAHAYLHPSNLSHRIRL
jgi:hypothetical protein